VSQPQPYSPQHAFVADSATVPQFPGQSLDIEFQDVKTTTDQILANLALIQRDDGALKNGTVTFDTLSSSLQTAGLTPAALWATATAYAVGNSVFQNNSLYRCLIAHTSGVFATDLAAAKWLFVVSLPTQNLTGPITSVGAATSIASQTGTGTKFVVDTSPTLAGVPLAPTAAPGTSTTQLATTAFVDAARVILAADTATRATSASPTFSGTVTSGGQLVVNSTSASALAVGANGATNPAFSVDASTASQVAGLNIKGAATGGTVSLSAIDSGANTSIQIKSKGTGTITLQADTGNATTLNCGVAGVSSCTLVVAGATGGALTVSPPAVASGTLNLAPGTMTGSSASAVWFDNIPQNSQSAAYPLVLADAQKHILHPTADNNARTFTIPANASVAYPIGTAITFVNQINTVTIAITTDTMTLAGAGTTGSRTLAANGIATALKIGTTSWIISGTGLT
jgi:hypothetical protein